MPNPFQSNTFEIPRLKGVAFHAADQHEGLTEALAWLQGKQDVFSLQAIVFHPLDYGGEEVLVVYEEM